MKNLFPAAATIAIILSIFSFTDILAAAQPIPGVDISAKKNPGGFPKKPSGIVHPTNKKCPAGYVFVDDGRDGACELLKDVAASAIPDADSGGDSASANRVLPTVNKKTAADIAIDEPGVQKSAEKPVQNSGMQSEKRKVKDIKDATAGSSGIAIGDPGVNGNRQTQSGALSSDDSSTAAGSRKEVKEFHPAEDQLKAAPRH